MKIILTSILSLLVISILSGIKANDYSFSQPDIPEGLWTQYPQGIAIAMTLVSRVDDKKKIESLIVYIRNITQKPFGFNPNDGDFGVRIFYVQNLQVLPLHQYRNRGKLDLDDAYLAPGFIKPGQTLRIRIDLNAEEVSLLRSNPVKCVVPVYTSSLRKKTSTIETSPQLLIETIETQPTH